MNKGVKINGISQTLNLSINFHDCFPTFIVVPCQAQFAGSDIVILLCYSSKIIKRCTEDDD